MLHTVPGTGERMINKRDKVSTLQEPPLEDKWGNSFFFFYFVLERKRELEQGRREKGEIEFQGGSMLSTGPHMGLNCTTL